MDGLRKIKPYVPGEQVIEQTAIKLNTNEHAYPPSPTIKKTLSTFDLKKLQRYSSVDNQALCQVIASQEGIDPSLITTSNGSDDILALAFQSFFQTSKAILFPDMTYGFYPVWCELYGISYQTIALDEQFHWPKDLPEKIGGVVLANPNAPTSQVETKAFIISLLETYPDQVIIVDEAYQAFAGFSVVSLVKQYENLYVTRTLSKDHALAGLRVGYGIGSEKLTTIIKAVKNSYNPYAVDALAETVAIAALKDQTYYQKITQEVVSTRTWFSQALTQLGFETLPSHTNFVLAKPYFTTAKKLYEQLKARQIYVRYFEQPPRLADYLRISIGTQNEMEQVITCIKQLQKEEQS